MTQQDPRSYIQSISKSQQYAQGPDARQTNITAAQQIADTIRTTLGPKGRDKMLISDDGTVVVTNDGSNILHQMDVVHPAASILISTAGSQEEGPGDGTSSTVIFAGELLGNAEKLLSQGLHPVNIIQGYRKGLDQALSVLNDTVMEIDRTNEQILSELAATTMTGRWDDERTDFLANLSVEAALAAETNGIVDLDQIALQLVTGDSVSDSTLIDGVAINLTESSTNIASLNPETSKWGLSSIALVDDEVTIEKADSVTNASVETADQMEDIRSYEDEVVTNIVRTLEQVGTDVLVSQKQVADRITNRLARRGILVVERTRQDEFDALESLTGASRVMNVSEIDSSAVAKNVSVELTTTGGADFMTVESSNGKAHTLLLRAATEHVLNELKRIFDDSLTVIKYAYQHGRVVPGGGATDMWLAGALRSYAESVEGKEQLAVTQFSEALKSIPETLARNAGFDPIDTMTSLRSSQTERGPTVGIDAEVGVSDMVDRGVIEPYEVKRRQLTNAVEATVLLLRIDDVIAAGDISDTSSAGETESPDLVGDEDGYPWAVGH